MADLSPNAAAQQAVLSVTEISVAYGVQIVLDRATIAINAGERIGLVGRNGTGKSTLLRLAAGVSEPDAGNITRRRELITGFLPQDFQLDDRRSVEENILAGASKVLALIAEYEALGPTDARADELLDHINHLDGWTVEHRVRSLIEHVGAPAAERLAGELSGGEKRRVALCRALVAQPDLLILDEPTNHLDTESILWLEDFLARYPGTCLFVTHDRYFLDRVANRIIELAGGKFHSHPGNYTAFLEAKAARAGANEATEARRQKFLKRELEWVRRGPKARRTKSRDRIDNYYAVAAQEAPEEELDVELIIPPAPKLANRVIELTGVGFTLPAGRTLFDGLTMNLEAGQRLGVVGRNGLGKTTLLRVMLGELPPTRGEVQLGTRTEINYVDQGRLRLDEEKTVYEEVGGGADVVKLGDAESVTTRGYLRRFLFTDDRVNTKIRLLSGGERSRVVLAKILRRGGNVLVLDEPTNDLDLATLRVVEEALVSFRGTVIAVSHDRYFLNRVCTSILAFEGEGKLRFDVGNYDDYLARRGDRQQEEKRAVAVWESAKSAAVLAKPAAAAKTRKLSFKEQQELAGMERRILEVEAEIARLETALAEPDFFRQNAARWSEFEAQLETARTEATRLYARWEQLEQARVASEG